MLDNINLDFTPDAPCSCGANRPLRECCRRGKDWPYVLVPRLLPPAPKSGHSNPKCYLRHTADCSEDISSEHYISRSILAQLPEVTFSGLPWATGPVTVGINSLTANILCRRHNSSLSPLDTEAGKLFSVLKRAADHVTIGDLKAQQLQAFISGPMIEMWAHKTAMAFFFAFREHPNAPDSFRTASVNPADLLRTLQGIRTPKPSGLWAHAIEPSHGSGPDRTIGITITTASDNGEISGLYFVLHGIPFAYYLPSPIPVDPKPFDGAFHRPGLVELSGPLGKALILLTWPSHQELTIASYCIAPTLHECVEGE